MLRTPAQQLLRKRFARNDREEGIIHAMRQCRLYNEKSALLACIGCCFFAAMPASATYRFLDTSAPTSIVSQSPQPSPEAQQTSPDINNKEPASPSTQPKATLDQRALLVLTVNQVPKGEIVVILRQGDILVRRSDLETAGLQKFSGRQENINNEIYVSLASLAPNVSFQFDEQALTLSLTAKTNLLGTTSINLGDRAPEGIAYIKNTSAFLNYAFNSSLNQNFKNYSFFGEAGISVNGNLLYSSFSRTTNGSFVRGLTNLTLDNPDKLTRWVVGDSFATAGNLGGGLFLGGISISREFSLNPYFIRQPTFALSGAVLTPSTVEVLVNGQRVRQENLPPGQFQFNNLILPAGNGATQVVIRDAFGREQVINSPFSFTSGLLQPGLSDYSFNLGFRRNNLESDSLNYGELAFLGRYSQGLTNVLTLGGRLEVAPNLISGGPTLVTALPFGAIELSAAASNESGIPGAAASLAYNYSGRIGFGGSVSLFSSRYANLSLKASDDRALTETNAFVSATISRNLSLGLQYANSNFRDKGPSDQISLFSTIRLTDRASLFINASRSSQPAQASTNELFLGLNYFFGGNTTANLSQQIGTSNSTILSVQKSAPVGEGFDYRLQLQPSEGIPGNARLEYRAPFGIYELDLDRNSNGQNVASLNISGGIVGIGGNVFFTRPVGDSFALVQVPGVAGVRGYADNQLIGQTNRAGNLFIPNLIPYYGNRLQIEAQDVPLNYNIRADERIIAPPLRGGAVVRFPISIIQSITGTISIETSGKIVIPAYGELTVTVDGNQVESPIGNKGEFYLENISTGRYSAKVEYEQGVCNFELNVPRSKESIVNLGNIKCTSSSTSPSPSPSPP